MEYNHEKERKIAEIMRHPDYNNSRAINVLLSALKVGVPLTDEERLFLMSEFTYRNTRPYKCPCDSKAMFKNEYKFLLREFREIENIPDELYNKYVTK